MERRPQRMGAAAATITRFECAGECLQDYIGIQSLRGEIPRRSSTLRGGNRRAGWLVREDGWRLAHLVAGAFISLSGKWLQRMGAAAATNHEVRTSSRMHAGLQKAPCRKATARVKGSRRNCGSVAEDIRGASCLAIVVATRSHGRRGPVLKRVSPTWGKPQHPASLLGVAAAAESSTPPAVCCAGSHRSPGPSGVSATRRGPAFIAGLLHP